MTVGVSIQNAAALSKQNFKLATVRPAILALLYLPFLPVIHGITNLDAVHTAELLEKFVSPIGIILFVPICRPEQEPGIKEVVFVKAYSYRKVVGIRLFMAALAVGILIIAFLGILFAGGCAFPAIPYMLGGIITALALGSIGILAAVLSNSTITGYLVSLGIWFLNWSEAVKESNPVYLFSMIHQQYQQKWNLFAIALVSIIIMLIYLKRVND